MSEKVFEVTILRRFCKGCGLCVEFCDAGKIYIEEKPNKQGIQIAALRPEVDCTGCLQCATICPDGAIEIRRIETPVGSRTGAAGEPDQ